MSGDGSPPFMAYIGKKYMSALINVTGCENYVGAVMWDLSKKKVWAACECSSAISWRPVGCLFRVNCCYQIIVRLSFANDGLISFLCPSLGSRKYAGFLDFEFYRRIRQEA